MNAEPWNPLTNARHKKQDTQPIPPSELVFGTYYFFISGKRQDAAGYATAGLN